MRPVTKEVLTQMCRIRPLDVVLRTSGATGDVLAPAIVQLALDHGPLPGVVAADNATHRGLTTKDALAEAVALLGRWPHSGRARTMLSLVDARSESVGETRLRVLLTVAGIRVVPQVPIAEPDGQVVGWADLVVDGTNVVIEFDGRLKYAAGGPEVLWAEKRREDGIRRLGHLVVRVTWADFATPHRIVGRVRREIARSSPRESLLHPTTLVG